MSTLVLLTSGFAAPTTDLASISLDSLLSIPVVTATKHAQSSLEAPASVTIVTSEDIHHYAWRNLEDALNSVRGFYLSDDRNYSFEGVRGYLRPGDYNNRILMLLNGQSLNEVTQGQPPLNTLFAIDLDAVDRIEIVRGPGSALYGTGAMFAVINVITKTAATTSGLTAGGSVATPNGGAAHLRYARTLRRNWDLMISAQASDQRGDDLYLWQYDTPETNNGVAHHLDWERSKGAFFSLRHRGLKLQSYLMARWKGIPTATWSVSFNNSRSKAEDAYGGGSIEYSRALNPRLQLLSRLYFNSFHYDGVFPYDPPDSDNPEYQNERRIGAELTGEWTPRGDERLIAGAEYNDHFRNEYYSADDEMVFFDEHHPFRDLSVFAQNELQFSRNIIFTTGLRQTWYSLGWRATVPRAAIVYLPARATSLKLLYGEAFRAPAISEAYYQFPEQSKANPELKPERIRTLELCAEHRLIAALYGTASVYNYRVYDLINTVLDETDNLTVFRNTGEASGYGGELEVSYRTDRGVSSYASYTYADARAEPSDEILSNSPRYLVKAGLTVPLTRRLRAATEFQGEPGRNTLVQTKTAPFALLNLALETRSFVKPVQAALFVKNVANTHYGNPGSWDHLQPVSAQDMPVIPQRGRTAGIRIDYQF
jgi:outer membrane receptor protein involved in Fe transport